MERQGEVYKSKSSVDREVYYREVSEKWTYPSEASEFITQLLNKTTNVNYYFLAFDIAKKWNTLDVWSALINPLSKLGATSAIGAEITIRIFKLGIYNFYKQDIEKLVSIVIKTEKYKTGILSNLVDFIERSMNDYDTSLTMQQVLENIAKDISPIILLSILEVCNEDTVRAIMDLKIETHHSNGLNVTQKIIEMIFRFYNSSTKVFNKNYFMIDHIVKNFKEEMADIALITVFNKLLVTPKFIGPDTINYISEFLETAELSKDLKVSIINNLFRIDSENEAMLSVAFTVTGDEIFAPKAIKDVFLF